MRKGDINASLLLAAMILLLSLLITAIYWMIR